MHSNVSLHHEAAIAKGINKTKKPHFGENTYRNHLGKVDESETKACFEWHCDWLVGMYFRTSPCIELDHSTFDHLLPFPGTFFSLLNKILFKL